MGGSFGRIFVGWSEEIKKEDAPALKSVPVATKSVEPVRSASSTTIIRKKSEKSIDFTKKVGNKN